MLRLDYYPFSFMQLKMLSNLFTPLETSGDTCVMRMTDECESLSFVFEEILIPNLTQEASIIAS